MMMVMAGCGPSLKEYVAKSSNYYSQISSATRVSVVIESNDVVSDKRKGVLGAIGAAVNLASSVSAMAVSHEQQERLVRLINTNGIIGLVAKGFDDGFVGTTHLVAVNADQNPDLRISLKVRRFGLWSESMLSPINFYMEAEIRVVDSATMETIYSNGATIMREASTVFSNAAAIAGAIATDAAYIGGGMTAGTITDNTSRLVGGAANLTAFFKLTDEDVVTIFNYMAYDAGLSLADNLTYAIYR